MYLAFLDGLDSLIEYYIPLAKEYPIALLIYLLVVALPIVALVFVWRLLRKRGRAR
jgi:cell division protein FtsL